MVRKIDAPAMGDDKSYLGLMNRVNLLSSQLQQAQVMVGAYREELRNTQAIIMAIVERQPDHTVMLDVADIALKLKPSVGGMMRIKKLDDSRIRLTFYPHGEANSEVDGEPLAVDFAVREVQQPPIAVGGADPPPPG